MTLGLIAGILRWYELVGLYFFVNIFLGWCVSISL